MNQHFPDHTTDRTEGLRRWRDAQGTRLRKGARWTWTKLTAAPWKLIGVAIAGGFAVLVTALLLFVTFADWNAFRGPIARFASAATGREIAITGDLKVHPWSWTPEIRVKGLRIGNQARFRNRGLFANVADADASIRLLPLLWGRFEIVKLDVYDADIALYRDATGDANWASAPSAARSTAQANVPAMRHFGLTNGHVRYIDDKMHLALDGTFTTQESNDPRNPGRFELRGDGSINARPFALAFSGPPLIHVRRDRPYLFNADIRAGDTHLAGNGSIAHPFDFNAWYADLQGTGADLADLYQLTGLTLPNTPPYDLRGRIERNGDVYGMPRVAGRVGTSDLAGSWTTRHRDGRLLLEGDFRTATLNFDDLLAVLGAPPTHLGRPSSPMQQRAAARLNVQDRVLPDARLNISRVRNMDALVSYRAAHVSSNRFNLRGFALDINLDRGLLRMNPLTLELAQGRITGAASINARESVPVSTIDVRLANARMESIFALRGNPPLTGELVGRAHLVGSGASVREAASNANGTVALVTPHGEVRESLAELTGINVTRGLGLLLAHDQSKIDIRCGVAHFDVRNGVATTRNLVFDTETMLIHGSGDVNLRNETLNLRLQGEPKQPRLVRLAAPITLRGHWRDPSVGVDAGRAVGQGGLAALLASVLSPIAVVLPFVDAGLAHDANCQQLLAQRAPAAPASRH
ncbi:MAG: AsmA family protein [Vitreimonas sp.]